MEFFYRINLNVINLKYNILRKEYDYLYKIILFYTRDKKHDCFNTYKNFEELKKDFEVLETNLSNIKKKIDSISLILKDKKYFQFLIDLDCIRKDISLYLDNYSYTFKNLFQNIEIGLNQYLPRPNIGASYSYKGINEYLLTSYDKFLSNFNENISLNLIWDFNSNYKIKNIDKKRLYISSNYYHQELPMNFSLIAHEIGHKMHSEDYFRDIKIDFEDRFLNEENILDLQQLSDELLADLFGLLLYGDGFIISAIVELCGAYFCSSFYNDERDRYEMIALGYDQVRDSAMVRMISLYNLLDFVDNNLKIHINIKDELGFFINALDNGFEKTYNKSQYFNKMYKEHFKFLDRYALAFVEIIKEKECSINKLKNKINSSWDKTQSTRDIYTNLWKSFITNSDTNISGYFRELLLDGINCEAKKISKKHKIAVFGKMATFKIEDKDEIEEFYKDKNFLFGIYDFFKIIDYDEMVAIDKDVPHYEQHNLLMEICSNEENIEYRKDIKNKNFNLFIMIKIEENCNIEHINKDIENIKVMLDINCKYTIYKLLGPKDLVCMVESITIDELFNIKDKLHKEYVRTHSYIYINSETKNIQIEENHMFKALIRSKKGFDGTDFLEYGEVFLTSGVLDYEVRFKDSIIDIDELYKIKANKYISDIQFKIDKYIIKEKNVKRKSTLQLKKGC